MNSRLFASRLLTCVLASSAFLCVAACGPPAPMIQYTISIETISQTPPQERQSVAEAYRAHYLSQVQVDHVGFLLSDIEYEIGIAKMRSREIKQREELSAMEMKRNNAMFKSTAAKSADTQMQSHKKDNDSQKLHVSYLKAQRRYLKKRLQHANSAETHAVATFELAKAQLAQKRKTVPKGFKIERFVTQKKRALEQMQRFEKAANSARGKALEVRPRAAKSTEKK
ncbi:MAG: hypothetical protein JKY56_24030 [Kofleriaceae bacterium]|nr:hypothetical protein [Kofleriaceae bacterium]